MDVEIPLNRSVCLFLYLGLLGWAPGQRCCLDPCFRMVFLLINEVDTTMISEGTLILADDSRHRARFHSRGPKNSRGHSGDLEKVEVWRKGRWQKIGSGSKAAKFFGKEMEEVYPYSAIITRGPRPCDLAPPGMKWDPGTMTWVPGRD